MGGRDKLCVKMNEFVGEISNNGAFGWLISICISRWRVLMTIPEGDWGAEKREGEKGPAAVQTLLVLIGLVDDSTLFRICTGSIRRNTLCHPRAALRTLWKYARNDPKEHKSKKIGSS